MQATRPASGDDELTRATQAGRPRYIDAREVLQRYLAGRLGIEQEQAFEQACRNGEHLREQLLLARDIGRTARPPGGRKPTHRLIAGITPAAAYDRRRLMAALLASLAGAALLALWHMASGDGEVSALSRPHVSGSNTVVIVDQPRTRDETTRAISVGSRAERLTLVPAIRSRDAADWTLELASIADPASRWRSRSLASRQPLISVPARALQPGLYELRVSLGQGGPEAARLRVYRFHIESCG